jgi:hypothetical protein
MASSRKLFEGWQAGLVVILFALVAVIVSVPYPALPDEIPRPVVSFRLVAQARSLDDALAAKAAAQPLDFDVRAFGEAIRLFGVADFERDEPALVRAVAEMPGRLQLAQAKGDESLLQLRAFQMKVFLEELQAFETTGKESLALRELAGGIIPTATSAGWIKIEGNRRQIVADDTVRRVLFKRRWVEVTGLRRAPFFVSLDEERVLYNFFLDHPVVHPAFGHSDDAFLCRAADEYRLKKVSELAAVDPKYPADYARGLLLLRLGKTREAVDPLSAFVAAHADGSYAIRARNTLRYAHSQLLSAQTL